ncbi:hypothetical protein D9758_005997 [Tetrapyrgos nigripes]|uniref:DNA polymerase alpha subunit B n=1 Tax=Tetrapyrgos nigripes TaxID=182062 RepID=A0A8H5G002_9AGAR|nr:hypothetical protein D9758_005997 [Tetrapyrgos nigripes]
MSSKTGLADEIRQRMGEQVASDAKLMAECLNICDIYNITAEDLQYRWEAVTYNSAAPSRALEVRFTADTLQTVKQDLSRNSSADVTRKTNTRGNATALANAAMKRKVPAFMNRNQAPKREDGVVKMEAVDGGVGASYDDAVASTSAVAFEGPKREEWKERAYRYMYEKPGERGEVLDDRIDEIAELIREYYKIPEFGDPSASTDEEVVVVGRIVHDQENLSSGAKLTDTNLAVESSRMLSNGVRVPLRLEAGLKVRGCAQGAGGFGLFPGAIIGLRGKNGGGGWFSVSEIIAPPPMKSTPPLKRDPGSFSMYIGSGPFTPDANLDYSSWKALLKILKQTKPAVVVLIGPFVDCKHPMFESGEVDEGPLTFFRRVFLEPLRDFLASSPLSIVALIPSIRDLISSHVVFPQCELGPEASLSNQPRIKLLPNPAVFSLNGIRFSASSVDVLFHLRTQELLKRGEEVGPVVPLSPDDSGSDAMGNLCRHILQQRSFYPIFPVPLDVSSDVNLDVTHSKTLSLEENPPDVLILPSSKLKQFSKRVQTTRVVNPSSLLKNVYATVSVSSSGIEADVIKMEE